MSDSRSDRRTITVEIAGERHVLRSDASPDYTRSVAAHVDATIRAMGLGNTLEPHRASILAALTITDELFRAREELAIFRDEIVKRAANLAVRLDEASDAAQEPAQEQTPEPDAGQPTD